MKKVIIVTLIASIFFYGSSCREPVKVKDASKTESQRIDTSHTLEADIPVEPTRPPDPEYGVIDTVISDVRDSTLLKMMYGSYAIEDGKCITRLVHDSGDTVAMSVRDRIEDDSVLIVYITGVYRAMRNHVMYYVSGLILNRVKQGWKLTDVQNFIGQEQSLNDYSSTTAIGKYCGRLLMVQEFNDDLANQVMYSWAPRHKFDEPTSGFNFLMAESGGDACVGEYHGNICEGCHDLKATLDHTYDSTLACLIFTYRITRTAYQCDYTQPRILATSYQLWYMNADTSFLARGAIFNPDEEWDRIAIDSVHMTDSQIRAALRPRHH